MSVVHLGAFFKMRLYSLKLFSMSRPLQELKVIARLLVIWLVVSSCQGNASDNEIAFNNLNIQPIDGQAATERNWLPNGLGEKVIELPAGTEEPPISPSTVTADASGYFYVSDLVTWRIQQFDAAGNYVTSFGEGRGEGPGEFTTLLSLGFLGDSLLWFLDYSQQINYYRRDGSLIWTERLESRLRKLIVQLAITPSGRRFFMFSSGYGDGNFFETKWEGEEKQFGSLQFESGWEVNLPLYGSLLAYKESMIYVPDYYPLVIRYDSDGNLVYARTAMDYGLVGEPEWVTIDGRPGKGPPRNRVSSLNPSIDAARLFVHSEFAQAIDVYDVETGDYLYSVKAPDYDGAYVLNERLYTVQSSSGVSVWTFDYAM